MPAAPREIARASAPATASDVPRQRCIEPSFRLMSAAPPPRSSGALRPSAELTRTWPHCMVGYRISSSRRRPGDPSALPPAWQLEVEAGTAGRLRGHARRRPSPAGYAELAGLVNGFGWRGPRRPVERLGELAGAARPALELDRLAAAGGDDQQPAEAEALALDRLDVAQGNRAQELLDPGDRSAHRVADLDREQAPLGQDEGHVRLDAQTQSLGFIDLTRDHLGADHRPDAPCGRRGVAAARRGGHRR